MLSSAVGPAPLSHFILILSPFRSRYWDSGKLQNPLKSLSLPLASCVAGSGCCHQNEQVFEDRHWPHSVMPFWPTQSLALAQDHTFYS